jgi:hypothetical protein
MKDAVRVFNAWVRRRDGKCVQCGTKKRLTAGHLISARRLSTRFDEQNVFGQCAKENYIHQYRPELYTAWFVDRVGPITYLRLVDQSKEPHKFTRSELEAIIQKYS